VLPGGSATAESGILNPSPWTAILAMSIGANLSLTGSVATVICRRLAHESGARFSLSTFTIVGVTLLPIQLAIAFVGLLLSGALPSE
jgi:Na+/H+ antiporter NhaD/arsenite permease-like protein